jgi:hypothetical protein
MLGDDANAELNRRSTVEDEEGGRDADPEACGQFGMGRNVHLQCSQTPREGFLLIGQALRPSPQTTVPENKPTQESTMPDDAVRNLSRFTSVRDGRGSHCTIVGDIFLCLTIWIVLTA